MASPPRPQISTGTAYSSGTIELEWFFSSTPGTITSYRAGWILNSEYPGGTLTYTTFSASAVTDLGNNGFEYDITQSLSDGYYTIFLRATNADGNSEWGRGYFRVGATPPPTPSIPDDPGSFEVTAFATSALLTWGIVSANPPVTDYEIRYQTGDTAGGTPESIGSTDTRYTITGLSPGTEYTAQVRGINDNGEGDWSSAVTFTTLAAPWEVFLDFSNESDIDTDTYKSLWVTYNRIFMTQDTNADDFVLEAFEYDGDAQTTENKDFGVYDNGRIEAMTPFGKNRIIGVYGNASEGIGGRVVIIRDFAEEHGTFGAFEPGSNTEGNRLKDIKSVAVTTDGLLISDGGGSSLTNATSTAGIYLLRFQDFINASISNTSDVRPMYENVNFNNGDFDGTITDYDLLASRGDRIYVSKDSDQGIYTYDTDRNILADENIPLFAFGGTENRRDMTVYGKYLYYLTDENLYRIDLQKARAPRVKQTIYPQSVMEGSSLDVSKFAEGADTIEWDMGFTAPSHLTISSNSITVGSISENTSDLLKLLAKNDVGGTSFEFYFTAVADAAPVWEDVSDVPMKVGDTLDVFRLVKNANSITWRSGFTQPSDTDLTDGIFSFTGTPTASRIEVQFTATNPNGSTHITFHIDVIKTSRQVQYSDTTRYRLEIEGIDVTDDFIIGTDSEGRQTASVFQVTENLDVIGVNTRTVGDCQFTLDNAEGTYNTYIADNFWETNSLNAGGFHAGIKLYIDSLVSGSYVEDLIFSGIIIRTREDIPDATIELTCTDLSYLLRNATIGNIGLPKQSHLFRQDETSYEGVYTPESSTLPILQDSASAVSGSTPLTLKSVANQSEGVSRDNSAYVTASDLRTQGGYLDDRPLLDYKTQYRRRSAHFLIDALSVSAGLFNASVNITPPELDSPFFTSFGNIGFNTEATRITRLVVDWIPDPTNNTLYILMSNPESHVADQLVRYDIDADRYRVLHHFPLGVRTHRLTSSDYDTFYILATTGDSIDGSRVPRPRITQDITDAYDTTVTENSHIRRYVLSTSVETGDFLPTDDTNSAQAGLHYFVGFSNKHTLREYESLLPQDRSDFSVYNDLIYYRYATSTAFGVATVSDSGTTAALFSETPDLYYNTTNFAFDLAENGDVYFGFVSGGNSDADTSLTIKNRDSGGTVTEIISDSKALSELTDIDDAGGAYSGVHEVLFHDDYVYVVTEIQRVRLPNDIIDFDTQLVAVIGDGQLSEYLNVFAPVSESGIYDKLLAFLLPTGNTAPLGLSIDGDDAYCVDTNDNVYVFPKNTAGGTRAVASRTFTLPTGNTNPQGLVVDGDDVYSVDNQTRTIYVFPKNTANGTRAVASRTFLLPNGNTHPQGLAIDGDDMYCVDNLGDRIFIFPKNTANGTRAVTSRSFLLPTGNNIPAGLTIIDDSVYCTQTQTSGSSMYIFPKNTANGQRPTGNDVVFVDLPGDERALGIGVFGPTDARRRKYDVSAGAALYRVSTTDADPELELMETYDFTQFSCRSLVVHDSEVHFAENPSIAYQFRPINPDLNTYNQSLGYNILAENNGALKRVSDEVREIGALWYEDEPFYGIQTKALSFNERMHVITNSSRTDDLLRPNSASSQATNSQWIVYGRHLDYILPNISATGTVFGLLSDVAQNTGTQFAFRQNLIEFQEATPYRALTNGTIGTTLPFDGANREFPDAGYLLIGSEIIQYTGRNFIEFTGLTRGVLLTSETAHADNSEILYLDNIINISSISNPYRDIQIRLDTGRFYNVIRDSGGLVEARDTTSIDQFGERVYGLSLDLTRHEASWIDFLANRQLDDLKEIRYLVRITLNKSSYLKLGDIISFYYGNTLLIPTRIVGVSYTDETTQIIGRSV